MRFIVYVTEFTTIFALTQCKSIMCVRYLALSLRTSTSHVEQKSAVRLTVSITDQSGSALVCRRVGKTIFFIHDIRTYERLRIREPVQFSKTYCLNYPYVCKSTKKCVFGGIKQRNQLSYNTDNVAPNVKGLLLIPDPNIWHALCKRAVRLLMLPGRACLLHRRISK